MHRSRNETINNGFPPHLLAAQTPKLIHAWIISSLQRVCDPETATQMASCSQFAS
jgi:hypothetical protein